MPPRLRLLIGFVLGTGLVSMAAFAPRVLSNAPPAPWRIAVCVTAFAVGDIALLHMRFGTHRYSFTWGEVAVVLGLVLLPIEWLVLVAPLAVAPAHLMVRRSAVKVAFNTLSYATGVTLAYGVIAASGSGLEGRLIEPASWILLLLATSAYFLWNGLTVAGAVALSQKVSLSTVIFKGLPLKLLVLVGNTLSGTMLVVMAELEPMTLVLVPCLLGVLYLVYQSYLRAMQERDTWQVLQATSRELLRTERSDVADVVLDRTGTLLNADFVELLLVDPTGTSDVATIFRRTTSGERVQLEGKVDVLGGSFWGRAACELEPFELDRHDSASSQRRDLDEHGVHLCFVAPLLVQDQCLGTLRIGFAGPVKLNGRDRQVFTTFANHVAGAVHNTRLFGEVRSQALHDPLTGLPNRALLSDRLVHAQARAGRGQGRVAVLFLDLDRFKVINDSLGHHVGDELLIGVGQRLTANLRPGDTAGRFGGDEFIVVCDSVTDEAEALRLADRLVASLHEPFTISDHHEPVFLGASVGVALANDDADDPITLIRDADAAMYRAKERGRSRVELFDFAMRQRAVARLETENDLRRAIERDELRLAYQPFVDVASQRVVGAEALVRWDHPRRGEVGPGEFIGLAEETGLIRPLGRWVMHEAFAQLARWTRTEGWPSDFTLSVNLSAHQLGDPDLLDDVTEALAATGVDPALICLEITESALVDDIDAGLETLHRLRAIGVHLSLDDFGTGYSSFSYLHRLPVDVLKIDRSFVSRLGQEARDRAVVAGMIELSHALGLRVVAEGVETPGQLSELGDLSCDIAQGYYFSAPDAPGLILQAVRVPSIDVPSIG